MPGQESLKANHVASVGGSISKGMTLEGDVACEWSPTA